MVYLLTGVSGSGKTTIGQLLAQQLGISFYDGDTFHSTAAIEKMRGGIPLEDEDRLPWLHNINAFIRERMDREGLVIACSALKAHYRTILSSGIAPVKLCWIHLSGSFELIQERLRQRTGHFMGAQLLESQFAVYEKPNSGICINIEEDPAHIIERILAEVHRHKADAGIIGLGVMGANLARNLAEKGFTLALYNRRVEGVEEDIAQKAVHTFPELHSAYPFEDLQAFVAALSVPRKILLMVPAGTAVDDLLTQLTPLLSEGDFLIDGGNSHYKDTIARQEKLAAQGLFFIGTGISGGEEGARTGPSIMPGGSSTGFEGIKNLLYAMAARNEQGETCCAYIGAGGAGHFVKMAHNGIEYAEMQLIAEIYSHLRYDQQYDVTAIARLFDTWNAGEAGSYLLQITAAILRYTDTDGSLLLDKISDQAGAKGTGSWATIAACELGVAIPSISAALFARFLSTQKSDRVKYSALKTPNNTPIPLTADNLLHVFQFCRIANHIQGLQLIQAASDTYNWNINLESLLQCWSGGCILQSRLITMLREACTSTPVRLLELPFVAAYLQTHFSSVQQHTAALMQSDQPYPVILAGMEYFKYSTCARSNANLLQAQRDYFGAHTYQLLDDPTGKAYHTPWKQHP